MLGLSSLLGGVSSLSSASGTDSPQSTPTSVHASSDGDRSHTLEGARKGFELDPATAGIIAVSVLAGIIIFKRK